MDALSLEPFEVGQAMECRIGHGPVAGSDQRSSDKTTILGVPASSALPDAIWGGLPRGRRCRKVEKRFAKRLDRCGNPSRPRREFRSDRAKVFAVVITEQSEKRLHV